MVGKGKLKAGHDAPQIIVPVAEPENAVILARWAERIACAKDAKIVLLNVVTLPYQTPLQEETKVSACGLELLMSIRQRMECGSVDTVLLYGRSAAGSIADLVREKGADLLVVGWNGRFKSRDFEVGSSFETIIRAAPTDCLVIRSGITEKLNDSEIQNILMPTKGGFHSTKQAEMTSLLADALDADVTVFSVQDRGEDDEESPRHRLQDVLRQFGRQNVSLKMTEAQDIAWTIVKESVEHDLVVIGATEAGSFQRMVFGTVAQKIVENCPKTVIMVKQH